MRSRPGARRLTAAEARWRCSPAGLGFAIAPVRNGRVVEPDEFAAFLAQEEYSLAIVR